LLVTEGVRDGVASDYFRNQARAGGIRRRVEVTSLLHASYVRLSSGVSNDQVNLVFEAQEMKSGQRHVFGGRMSKRRGSYRFTGLEGLVPAWPGRIGKRLVTYGRSIFLEPFLGYGQVLSRRVKLIEDVFVFADRDVSYEARPCHGTFALSGPLPGGLSLEQRTLVVRGTGGRLLDRIPLSTGPVD
jgi:hypothetical protein